MIDSRFVCTVAAVLFVTAASAVAVNLGRGTPSTVHESIAGVELPSGAGEEVTEQDTPDEPDYAYIIREHEGQIAVFSAEDDEEPALIYNTPVKYLPDYDRNQMQEGIKVQSYRELIARIEDYIS